MFGPAKPSGLRRRGGLNPVSAGDSSDSDGAGRSRIAVAATHLRSFDVIAPKLEQSIEEQMVRSGGPISSLVTLLMLALIAWLVVSESWLFFVVGDPPHETITVDVQGSQRLPIRFNISFPSLRCSEANVDVVDKSGEQQLRLSTRIWKLRRLPASLVAGLPAAATAAAHAPSHTAPPGVGSSAAAQFLLRRQRPPGSPDFRGQPPSHPLSLGAPIGRPFQDDGRIPLDDLDGEGCTIWGEVLIQKLAGNLHVALGASRAVSSSQHVHNFQYSRAHLFNASHVIHELSFGEPYPGMPPGPLTGVQRNALDPDTGRAAIAHHQYFVSVVPTEYRRRPEDPAPLRTNQYSVTENTHICRVFDHTMTAQTIPGLFISWELSPFLVQVTQNSRGLLKFLTSLCAIVGGVFTIGGLIDSCLYHAVRRWRKR